MKLSVPFLFLSGAASACLIGDLSEEVPLGVLAAPLVPVVSGHGHKVLARHADDFRIGKSEHTARHAVVSGAAKRIAVHLPQEDRLTGGSRLPARFPQAGQPRDLCPLRLVGMGANQFMEA